MTAATQTKALWATLAMLAAVKAGFLAALGPVYLPDSKNYTMFADVILGGGDWMTQLDLGAELYPLTAFRAIGYPTLIALFKILTPIVWPWIIVIIQMATSLAATAMVWQLTHRLTGRTWTALFAALAHSTAQGFALDQCILTDSLHASLLIITTAYMGTALLDARAPTIREALALGLLLLAAFLLREVGAVLQYALWPLITAWCLTARAGLRRTGLILMIFALPLFAGIQAYKAWNHYRTGERFITTVAQTAMYHPVVDLARQGVPVFADDPLLADAPILRQPLPAVPGITFSRINQHLNEVHGLNALAVARHAESLFYTYWQRFPLARARIYLSKFDPAYSRIFFMPLTGIERLSLWAGGGTPFPLPGTVRTNLFEHGRVDQALLLAARTIARLISAVLMTAFIIGVPALVIRRLAASGWRPGALSPRETLLAVLWLFAMAYPAVYALVYLEDRYLIAVAPFVVVSSLALTAPWVERVAAWIRTHHPRRTPNP